jgi:O-antigen/teichoic acid export membrane protein
MEQTARDARHVARSGVVQLLAALGQGLMPVTHILIARLFGPAVFGAYQASAAMVEVLARAGPLGAVSGEHRFIAAHRAAGETELAQRALGTGIRMAAAASAILAVVLALLARPLARAWNEPSLAATLPIMAPMVLLAALMQVMVGATMGAKVARMNLYVRGLAEPLLLLVAVVAAWRLGGGLRNLALAYLVTGAIVAALAVVACARVFGAAYLRQALGAERHPGFVRFALPLGGSDLMSAVLQRADTFIVATFAGLDALAVYTAAEYVTRIIANPRYLFDHVIAPVVSEALHMKDRARVRYNLALVTRWVVTASLPIAISVVVLRAEILRLYGGAFAGGSGTVVILALGNLIVGCLGLTPYVLAMGGRSRPFLLNNLGAAALNVALGVVLVPRFGITGGAIAVLISVTVFQVALTVEAWFLERVHPFTMALTKPVAAALVMAAAEIALHATARVGAARVGLTVAGGAGSYLAALIAFGLAPDERALLRRLRERLRPPRRSPP